MGLLPFIVTLPLQPVKGVISLAELIRVGDARPGGGSACSRNSMRPAPRARSPRKRSSRRNRRSSTG